MDNRDESQRMRLPEGRVRGLIEGLRESDVISHFMTELLYDSHSLACHGNSFTWSIYSRGWDLTVLEIREIDYPGLILPTRLSVELLMQETFGEHLELGSALNPCWAVPGKRVCIAVIASTIALFLEGKAGTQNDAYDLTAQLFLDLQREFVPKA